MDLHWQENVRYNNKRTAGLKFDCVSKEYKEENVGGDVMETVGLDCHESSLK